MALNRNLQQLVQMAQKPHRLALGLMSGTSMDGLDIALCQFTGSGMQTGFKLQQFVTIPYQQEFKNAVNEVFAKRSIDLQQLCLLNAAIARQHAALVLRALKTWQVSPAEVDFIASHGQTVYHAPAKQHSLPQYPNATLQIGDGDHLAVLTGIFTISDFRQKHIAAGGEGAPLALYGEVLLGSKAGQNRILLNMGGISNLTWLPGNADSAAIICTDVGPGNTLIDAACKKYYQKDYDADGNIAMSGSVVPALLDALLNDAFFAAAPPKTTGPEVFNWQFVEAAMAKSNTANCAPANVVATLSSFTALAIAQFIKTYTNQQPATIFASGGGAYNPYLMQALKNYLPHYTIDTTAAIGLPPDAKEAILFALLGNQALCGEPIHIGNNPAVLMGKFSFAQ